MIACRQLLAEVAKALRHPRIASRYNISEEEVANLTLRLQQEAIFVRDPLHPPRVVPDDPSDDYLVALALGAGADALVTRDHHFDGVRVAHLDILSPITANGWLWEWDGDHRNWIIAPVCAGPINAAAAYDRSTRPFVAFG